MDKIRKFEDILAWQSARELCSLVHSTIKGIEWHESAEIKKQIYRSSGSVMDNIAEGYDRDKNGEFLYFLSIAKGSCSEVKSQVYRLHDFEIIDKANFTTLMQKANRTTKLIGGFIKYMKSSNYKGSRKVILGDKHQNTDL